MHEHYETNQKKKNEENLLEKTKLAFIYLCDSEPHGHSE